MLEIILGNTFHLMLRPGVEVIEAHGDLHDFMHWNKPILTDSGGFQVFSLDDMRKITEEGVHFRSPVDGRKVFMGPEESMQVQKQLGSDIVMIFDECTPFPANRKRSTYFDGVVVTLGRNAVKTHMATIPLRYLALSKVVCMKTCVMFR